MLIGYARVSTREQEIALQTDALELAGCEQVYADLGVSGTKASRPELDKALANLRKGDALVVWKLDRLGRNTKHTLDLLDDLAARGVKFRSLTEGIDTTGAMGKVLLTIIAAFAQLERDVLSERTMAGLAAARARGRSGGRPRVLSPAQHQIIRTSFDAGTTAAELARMFKVSPATVWRSLGQPVSGKDVAR